MNPVTAITSQCRNLGYASKALIRNYRFPDVLTEDAPERVVPLAAFTDTPTSYRNAAFGVLTDCKDASAAIQAHRALGAPVWFCVCGDQVEVWNTRGAQGAVRETVRPLTELEALFAANRDTWAPDRIHQAKLAGFWDQHAQLSFVDYGLLKDIEMFTQEQLDRIINRTLKTLANSGKASTIDYRRAYRACFYLVAAKIVLDRGHTVGKDWPVDDAQGILDAVSAHYRLSYAAEPGKGIRRRCLDEAWSALRDDVSFANISVDDLAFVYENTLVSPETRKELGTHSTPRAVAEFLVSRLRLSDYGHDAPKIYEPFCGAGVLLVAALSKLRNHLPRNWTDAQRHAFLVRRLRGAEVDAFACEVVSLSLVLADYPSSNGWDIQSSDLFKPGVLTSQVEPGAIVLCNPPFEDFSREERNRYAHVVGTSVHKPLYVLDAILAAKPEAIGFVLPNAVVSDRQYAPLRQRLEQRFNQIELVSLPDRVFAEADFESALLVARDPRPEKTAAMVTVRSATVADANRDSFLGGHYRPEFRENTFWSNPDQPDGNLWVPELAEIWDYLATYPTLGSIAKVHRGLEWQSGHQRHATSQSEKSGFRRGFHSSKNLYQFFHAEPIFLDCRPEYLRAMRVGAIQLPWHRPKVILNAVRKSRGAWRLAASLDTEGLVLSQQLIGCWSRSDDSWLPLIEGILNSPLASAFVGIHNPRKGFRLEVLERLPVPPGLVPDAWTELIADVHGLAVPPDILSEQDNSRFTDALLALDAAVLKAYALPARLERKLLAYFEHAKRPVFGAFSGYPDSREGMALTLAEQLAGRFEDARGGWVHEVFTPLPETERELVANYLR